jgi:uncharacterized protein YaaR (DUF327 family)
MKINPGLRPFGNDPVRNDAPVNASVTSRPFAGFMNDEREVATQEEFMKRMKRIMQQGDRLTHSMSIRELREYKMLVHRFLEDTVRKGIGLKETRGWDRRGRTKRYQILEDIDKMLVSMADELLSTETGRIELLGKMGEIRGLLINLAY